MMAPKCLPQVLGDCEEGQAGLIYVSSNCPARVGLGLDLDVDVDFD